MGGSCDSGFLRASASSKLGSLRRINRRLNSLVLRLNSTHPPFFRPLTSTLTSFGLRMTRTTSAGKRLESINPFAARAIFKNTVLGDLPRKLYWIEQIHGPCLFVEKSSKQCSRPQPAMLAVQDQLLAVPQHFEDAILLWLETSAPDVHSMRFSMPFYSAFSTWNLLPSSLKVSPSQTHLYLFLY